MTAVQGAGWYAVAGRYADFLQRHQGQRVLFLELGVGENTPAIIKYPFWKMTVQNPKAVYACVNQGQAYAPEVLAGRALCINGEIGQVLQGCMDSAYTECMQQGE